MQYFKFSSNQRGPREHRGSREYIPRLLRAGKSRTPPANSKIMALLRDNLIHSWDSSLILIVIPIETITSCLKQTLFYILSLISTSLTSTSFVHVCCGKQQGGKELKKLQWKETTVWNKPTLQLNFSSTWSLTTKFEYQPCPGFKSKMFNSDLWADEENSPGTHISGTLPKEARGWPTTHQRRYRSLWFRPAFLLCYTPLELEKTKKWAAFPKEWEWERECLWKL